MLYVVFSFVFIKYVNDRLLLNLVDRSTLRSHSPPPRLFLLSHPARVTRSLQEVVPSFAVAKVYQIPNTNQIFPRKTSENMLQSYTHFPLNKTLTTMEKILRQQRNIPSSLPRDHTQVRPKIIRIAPSPPPPPPLRYPKTQPKGSLKPQPQRYPKTKAKGIPRARLRGAPRARQKGATSPPRLRADA